MGFGGFFNAPRTSLPSYAPRRVSRFRYRARIHALRKIGVDFARRLRYIGNTGCGQVCWDCWFVDATAQNFAGSRLRRSVHGRRIIDDAA
jgi:hypothetical protein